MFGIFIEFYNKNPKFALFTGLYALYTTTVVYHGLTTMYKLGQEHYRTLKKYPLMTTDDQKRDIVMQHIFNNYNPIYSIIWPITFTLTIPLQSIYYIIKYNEDKKEEKEKKI